jgi:hypothetical protein
LRLQDWDSAKSSTTASKIETEIFLEGSGFRLCAVSYHSQ